MTSHKPHPAQAHGAPGADKPAVGAPDTPAIAQAGKDRAKSDHQHEDARRRALASAQHKESPRTMAAPKYHGGHRGG
ncbi:hypothetical protein RAS12_04245 [Achromobacter seleniivolatilans]|uniref:DUF5302 domain-containing protein n=1 Tax=Achromobacter seleniivolatilans TaxID=3047478 RepID=A0ABY9M3M6_9BURK|nr:hypothetical protein [Achromobacter sp. R39]WMD21594.1 hypothetical protein RAS12_04245 [Achromobacter sp. R39]